LNPVRTVGQTLEEPLLAHEKLNRTQRRQGVAAALDRVGLDAADAGRYPDNFSGGQRQRIAIARALMLSPQLIICDEAVSALDLSIQAQILNLLRALQRELGLSLLFITHDMSVVRHISDRVAVLYQGQLMEDGAVADVCDRPAHPYTRRLLAAAPVPDPVLQRQRQLASVSITALDAVLDGCPFRPRCEFATEVCAEALPRIATATGMVACHHHDALPPLSPMLAGPRPGEHRAPMVSTPIVDAGAR
jgi:peptide/nickel transport system ATP-binding protein